jgi:hypothetical protein
MMSKPPHVVVLCLLVMSTLGLAACPAKDEKGVDFAKTQRESRDKARTVEQTVLDAAAKRGEVDEKP